MRRSLIVVLCALLMGLQYRVWVADGGVSHTYRLREQVRDFRAENQRRADRNAALQAEVDDLKSGLAAIEERARLMLGLVRDGETYYMVLPAANDG